MMERGQSKRKLAIALAACAVLSLVLPMVKAENFEAYVFNGTLTQFRPINGCTHSAPARATATYVTGELVAIDIVSEDGLTISTAREGGAYASAHAAAGVSPWCSVTGTLTVTSVQRDCSGNTLSVGFFTGGTTFTFGTPATGQCADNVAVVTGPVANPTPVSLVIVTGLQGGPTAGCVGLVTLRLQDGSTVTLPAFGNDCSRASLCAAYDGKPGVASCTVAAFPPPQRVTQPASTSTAMACVWNQAVGVDLNGDNVPEFSTTAKTLTLAPCS